MKFVGIALAILTVMSCIAIADEPLTVVKTEFPAQGQDTNTKPYELKWQRRVLAVQLAFAATLQKTDPVETGSISHQSQ